MKFKAFIILLSIFCGCKPPEINYTQIGEASYYHHYFKGRTTASGDIYDPNEFTAAHQHLPFGTVVEVISLETGKSITVTINDRGPFIDNRIIDLSKAAAESLDILEEGVVMVELKVIVPADGYTVADSVEWRQ